MHWFAVLLTHKINAKFTFLDTVSTCTVAANKKFPFRFRGTLVQRFCRGKKKGNSTAFAMGARATLLFFNITAEHDVDRWLANSGTT